MLNDLKKFLFRGNVLDLAVAVVVGAAFKAVLDAFVEFIINPIISAIVGKPDLYEVLQITLRETDDGDAVLRIGAFFQACIDFAIIGVALFMVIKTFESLQARRAAGELAEEETPAKSDELVVLEKILDAVSRTV